MVWKGYRSGDGASLAILELVERPGEITPPEKPKGKEKEKPKARPEKPKVQEKKVQPERPAPPKPREERPPSWKGEVPGQRSKEEKAKGFIDGLRRFFRRRENP